MKVFTARRLTALFVALGASVLGLSMAGCGSKQDDTAASAPPTTTVVNQPVTPPGTSTTTTTSPSGMTSTTTTPPTNNTNAGPGGATGDNASVADAVNKAIHTNTQMTGSRVTAVVDASGTAKLTGTAQNKQQKALAESTARQVSGVTHVVNKVEIVATGGVKEAAPAPTKVIVVHDAAPSTPASGSAATNSSGAGNTTDTTTTPSAPPAPAPAGGTTGQ